MRRAAAATLRYLGAMLAASALFGAAAPATGGGTTAPLVAAGATSSFDCETEAFGMDFKPFKKTNGKLRLVLTAKTADVTSHSDQIQQTLDINAPAGTWHIGGGADAHVASIGKLVATTCANGCPYTLSPQGALQLWAPQPSSLDKLGETDMLTIAVLKTEPLSVSISTFRGRDIVALEKGSCQRVEADRGAAAPTQPGPATAAEADAKSKSEGKAAEPPPEKN